MALWFKPEDGYTVPEAEGRYIDMGMSFKKSDVQPKAHAVPKRKVKRKPNELRELVYSHVTSKWQKAIDIQANVNAAVESVRGCLEKLVACGRIESNGIRGMKQYRSKK